MNKINPILLFAILHSVFLSPGPSAFSEEVKPKLSIGRYMATLIGRKGHTIPVVMVKDLKGIHLTLNHSRCVKGVILKDHKELHCEGGLKLPVKLWNTKDGSLEGKISFPDSHGKLLDYQLQIEKTPPPIDPGAKVSVDVSRDPTVTIGAGSKIGIKSQLADKVKIADNVTIGSHVTINSRTSIGSRSQIAQSSRIGKDCLIYNDSTIGSNSELDDNVIVSSNVSIGERAFLGSGVSVGTNSIIGEGITIAEDTQIPPCSILEKGAGGVIMKFRTDASLNDVCLESNSREMLLLEGKNPNIRALNERKHKFKNQLISGKMKPEDIDALTRYYKNGCFRKGTHNVSDCLRQ